MATTIQSVRDQIKERKSINFAEIFGPVIQGEGFSAGVPSIFMRVQNCNFVCGLHNGKGVGKIGPDGKEITWWCDTETVWKQGEPWKYDDVIEFLKEVGEWDNVMMGNTHIIFTGGEPTMPTNALDFMGLIDHMKQQWTDDIEERIRNSSVIRRQEMFYDGLARHRRSYLSHFGRSPVGYPHTQEPLLTDIDQSLQQVWAPHPVVEVETNGSIDGPVVDYLFKHYVMQINCSAKLANSGMPYSIRVRPSALDQICLHPNHWWKFVVSSEEDWKETMEDFEHVFKPRDDSFIEQIRAAEEKARIILMPAGSTQEELIESSHVAWDMAVKHNVRYTDRFQVRVWNMATGK